MIMLYVENTGSITCSFIFSDWSVTTTIKPVLRGQPFCIVKGVTNGGGLKLEVALVIHYNQMF